MRFKKLNELDKNILKTKIINHGNKRENENDDFRPIKR